MSTVTDRPHVVAPSVFDALLDPDRTAAQIAGAVPQGLLVEALSQLLPSALSVDGRIDALIAVERHIAMLQARSVELLSALDAGDTSEDRFTRDQVAAALRLPPASMKDRMTAARDLARRLPATLELLRAGEISQRHAAALVDATRPLTPELASAVEASVLTRAPAQTVAQFRASVKRAVLRVTTPDAEQAAHEDAVSQRRVVFIPAEDGMTEMWAYLSADSAALIKTTLDAMAHRTIHQPGGDQRTADQRRADALVDLARTALLGTAPTFPGCTHPGPTTPTNAGPATANPTDAGPGTANPASDHPTSTNSGSDNPRSDNRKSASTDPDPAHNDTTSSDPPPADDGNPTPTDAVPGDVMPVGPLWIGPLLTAGHGQRPAIQVTIAASTLMGLDDQPCELDGHGPITAAMARRIAADPTAFWRRLLTDDNGHVTAASTDTYRPTAEIARTVIARDQHCTFPGCRRASRYDDLDHVIPWTEGDDTTAANLMALCRRHHRLKHTGEWTVDRDDTTGTTTWTDNKGRTYLSRPPDLPTTTTATETAPDTPEPLETRFTSTHRTPARPAPATVNDDDPPPF